MTIGEKLIELRKKNNFTQEKLAEIMGVSRQSVSKWESNIACPDSEKLIKLSQVFQCSIDYLLKDDMNVDYNSNYESIDQNHDQNQDDQSFYQNQHYESTAPSMEYDNNDEYKNFNYDHINQTLDMTENDSMKDSVNKNLDNKDYFDQDLYQKSDNNNPYKSTIGGNTPPVQGSKKITKKQKIMLGVLIAFAIPFNILIGFANAKIRRNAQNKISEYIESNWNNTKNLTESETKSAMDLKAESLLGKEYKDLSELNSAATLFYNQKLKEDNSFTMKEIENACIIKDEKYELTEDGQARINYIGIEQTIKFAKTPREYKELISQDLTQYGTKSTMLDENLPVQVYGSKDDNYYACWTIDDYDYELWFTTPASDTLIKYYVNQVRGTDNTGVENSTTSSSENNTSSANNSTQAGTSSYLSTINENDLITYSSSKKLQNDLAFSIDDIYFSDAGTVIYQSYEHNIAMIQYNDYFDTKWYITLFKSDASTDLIDSYINKTVISVFGYNSKAKIIKAKVEDTVVTFYAPFNSSNYNLACWTKENRNYAVNVDKAVTFDTLQTIIKQVLDHNE